MRCNLPDHQPDKEVKGKRFSLRVVAELKSESMFAIYDPIIVASLSHDPLLYKVHKQTLGILDICRRLPPGICNS